MGQTPGKGNQEKEAVQDKARGRLRKRGSGGREGDDAKSATRSCVGRCARWNPARLKVLPGRSPVRAHIALNFRRVSGRRWQPVRARGFRCPARGAGAPVVDKRQPSRVPRRPTPNGGFVMNLKLASAASVVVKTRDRPRADQLGHGGQGERVGAGVAQAANEVEGTMLTHGCWSASQGAFRWRRNKGAGAPIGDSAVVKEAQAANAERPIGHHDQALGRPARRMGPARAAQVIRGWLPRAK